MHMCQLHINSSYQLSLDTSSLTQSINYNIVIQKSKQTHHKSTDNCSKVQVTVNPIALLNIKYTDWKQSSYLIVGWPWEASIYMQFCISRFVLKFEEAGYMHFMIWPSLIETSRIDKDIYLGTFSPHCFFAFSVWQRVPNDQSVRRTRLER